MHDPNSSPISFFSRISRGRGGAAVIDQAMVSGANFLANIVLVRGLGLTDFGKYFLAYAVLLYANALQMSFVTSPMLTLAPLFDGEKKRTFLRGMLAMQVACSLLMLAVGALTGLIVHQFTSYYSIECVFAIATSIGAFQLQDWLRRYYFLVGKKKLAVCSDAISYVLQLILLVLLWRTGLLTLTRIFWVMSGTSAAGFLLGIATDHLVPSLQNIRFSWEECKLLSRDLLISNQVRWFGDQGILMIATGIVGPGGIGGLRATQSLAGPVTLLLTSLDNVLPIRIAELLKSGGTVSAYRFTRRWIFLASGVLGTLLIPIAVFGRPLLRLVYGPAVIAFYIPMLLQLVNIIIGIATRLWFYLYRGVRDTRAILRANMLCAILSIGTVYPLGKNWDAPGIVLASVLGQVGIVSYCFVHWRRYEHELLQRFPKSGIEAGRQTEE